MRARLAAFAFDKGGLVALATLVIYGLLAPTWIVGGDNAEFAGLSELGGIAHPPGYPLYVLWLRAFSWLPGASVAHTAALATALIGALQILALHAACRKWGARPAAATAAVALYAASPVALLMGSQAETFVMNGLVGALVLWLAAPIATAPVRGARRVILLALVAGLGLADHVSCVLLAPVGIYGVVTGLRESTRRLAVAALGVAAFLVGLTPYLYAFVAPDTALSWGAIHDVGDLLHHVLRRDYGTGSLTPRGGDARPLVGVTSLVFTLGRAWWWAGLGVGLGMLGYAAAKDAARWAWRALAASFLLAGPIFVARFNLGPADVDAWIAERFHLLPALVLAIPVAVAIDRIATRVPASRPRLAHLVALALLPIAVTPSLGKLAAGHSRAVERQVANLLESLPPDAVVVTAGDDLFFGMAYAQAIDGRRLDVVPINWGTMGFPWYQRRISAQLGAPVLPAGPGVASVRMTAAILARGRPVFVDADQRNITAAFPSYPYGALIRVLPPRAEMPSLDEIVAENREVYERYDLRYPRPSADDGWSTVAHHRYSRGWLALAEAFERTGRPEDAAAARAAAEAIGPAK